MGVIEQGNKIEGVVGAEREAVVVLTTAQARALNATPITIVPAPGAGKAVVVYGALAHKPVGTAFGGIAGTEDIDVRYTDGSGALILNVELTGFLDQATVQTRYAPAGNADITPVANAAVVLSNSGAITGGSSVTIRVQYRILDL